MGAGARSYKVSMVMSVNNLSRKEAVTHQVYFSQVKGDVQQKNGPNLTVQANVFTKFISSYIGEHSFFFWSLSEVVTLTF